MVAYERGDFVLIDGTKRINGLLIQDETISKVYDDTDQNIEKMKKIRKAILKSKLVCKKEEQNVQDKIAVC